MDAVLFKYVDIMALPAMLNANSFGSSDGRKPVLTNPVFDATPIFPDGNSDPLLQN